MVAFGSFNYLINIFVFYKDIKGVNNFNSEARLTTT